ncbi:acylphosphatase [Chloroflexota bacterium]
MKVEVYGRVQGVFYRNFTAQHAVRLGLAGYVRNLADGTVEVNAEGEREDLGELLKRLKTGPPGAKVTMVVTKWAEFTGNFTDFQITY